jgi:hypothetical protein
MVNTFNEALFDRRCEDLGADTEVEKAALFGINVTTLFRYRKGSVPRLSKAREIAAKLQASLDDLWPAA